jgi:hypothetical protein
VVTGRPRFFFWITLIDFAIIYGYHKSKPRGSCNFRPGSNPSQEVQFVAQANPNHTTKLSALFRDEYVAAAFRAAEDDGLAPAFVEQDHPLTLDGGAAVSAELVEG